MRFLTFALLFAATPALAGQPHYPPLQGKPVVDAANVIPDDQEAALNKKLFAYEHTTHHQLMVATVPSLEGQDIESYATGYFRAVGLGGKDKDDGILFIVAPKERKVRIENGYGASTLLTDAQSGRILHDVVHPKLHANDFPAGINAGVDAIIAATPTGTEADQVMTATEKNKQQGRQATFVANLEDFFLWVLGVAGVALGLLGIHHFATRKQRAAERERLAKLEEEDRQRRAEAAAAAQRDEREREERLAREREERLARMTPDQREAFLAREEAARQADAERAIEAEAARRADEEREAARRRQQEEESNSYASSYSSSDDDSSSSSSSSDDDDSFSGGGGSSGGAGASDDF